MKICSEALASELFCYSKFVNGIVKSNFINSCYDEYLVFKGKEGVVDETVI